MTVERAAATTVRRSDTEIDSVIAGVDAGHRMASHEPSDFDRELGRRQLRGETSGDEAVALARREIVGRARRLA